MTTASKSVESVDIPSSLPNGIEDDAASRHDLGAADSRQTTSGMPGSLVRERRHQACSCAIHALGQAGGTVTCNRDRQSAFTERGALSQIKDGGRAARQRSLS